MNYKIKTLGDGKRVATVKMTTGPLAGTTKDVDRNFAIGTIRNSKLLRDNAIRVQDFHNEKISEFAEILTAIDPDTVVTPEGEVIEPEPVEETVEDSLGEIDS
jgi:hypothetical protein